LAEWYEKAFGILSKDGFRQYGCSPFTAGQPFWLKGKIWSEKASEGIVPFSNTNYLLHTSNNFCLILDSNLGFKLNPIFTYWENVHTFFTAENKFFPEKVSSKKLQRHI
jgi:hypothetical protein